MNAADIPHLGLGTSGRATADGPAAIETAIALGYRHIDTAQNYGTEEMVGAAIAKSGVPREKFFVTTKVADHRLERDDFLRSVGESLGRLKTEYIDLLLVHWPSEKVPFEGYMTALREAKERGWTKLIGVSNFTIRHLDQSRALLGDGVLATNQVEIHPFLQVPKMREYARKHGLLLTAYQPLAKATVGADPVLQRIGEKHGVPASTISLAFLLAEGHIVIPSSSREEHLRDNLRAPEVRLDEADTAAIRALDRGGRRVNPAKSPQWDD